MLLTTTAKKKTLFVGIYVYSRGIACFTDQRTAFTHAQGAILPTQDFNLHAPVAQSVEHRVCYVGGREFDSGQTNTQGLTITEEKVLTL